MVICFAGDLDETMAKEWVEGLVKKEIIEKYATGLFQASGQ